MYNYYKDNLDKKIIENEIIFFENSNNIEKLKLYEKRYMEYEMLLMYVKDLINYHKIDVKYWILKYKKQLNNDPQCSIS